MSLFHSLLTVGGVHVVSVDPVSDLNVSYNTEFFEVVFMLPIQVMVNTSDGNSQLMTVEWQEGSYDGTTAATYPITGNLTLPGAIKNPLLITATVDVIVAVAIDIDTLAGQIIWLRENNSNTGGQVDNWINKWNSALDLIKITDARRPGLNATGIEGALPSYEWIKANFDNLRSEGTTIGLTADFTIYIVFKNTDPSNATGQIIISNASDGSAAVNTGIHTSIASNNLTVQFRKNDAGDQQPIVFPFSSTAYHLMHIKHDANTTNNAINVVKLDGALILKDVGKDPVVHNSNQLKIGGNGFNTSNPFGGSFAEIIVVSEYHDAITESSVLDYFKTRYPTELSDIEFFDETRFNALDSVSEAWNGLTQLLRGDGKYDFIAGTLTGKIYYLEQGATINDWTTTLLVDTLREIQSLEIFRRDPSDRLILISAHKDSAATNDNIGKLMVHRADTTDDQGAYSSLGMAVGQAYPQDILIYDIDGDGDPEVIYSHEGTNSSTGGIRYRKCTDITAVLTGGNWTEYNVKTHPSAWWIAGIFNIGGTDRLVFSARNNLTRNPDAVPGIYYLTPSVPTTGTWTETTIDATVLDWAHLDVGNIFGNDNDIVAQDHDGDDIVAYNAASSFAKSTIITGGGSGVGTNLKIIPGNIINGRSSFISFTENDWAYLNYYNGSAWVRRRLFQTLGHPPDNEILYLDVDDSGFLTIVFDDNTNLVDANVRMFRL